MRGYHEEGEEKRESRGRKSGRENWVGVNEEGIGE